MIPWTLLLLLLQVHMASGLSIGAGHFGSFCISMGAVLQVRGRRLPTKESLAVTFQALRITKPPSCNLLQVVLAPSLGPLADHGFWRQRLMMGTTVLSGLIAACFGFIGENSDLYWLGGTLLALSSAIQGFGRIAYDSYLPILVRGGHIDCTTIILDGHGGDDDDDHDDRGSGSGSGDDDGDYGGGSGDVDGA